MSDFGNTPAPDMDTTAAPGVPPELTLEGGYSIVFIIFFIVLNVSGAASSIAALGITAMLFYFFGVISERQLWEGFGNGGIINLASLAVMVAALGNVPLVKRIAVYFFGGQKGHRTWQLTKILIISYIVALLLPNANQVQLFTPLIRTACIETGMNVQFPLMAMCIVANIANGFAISSNSNIIVGGLWKAKFGYSPGFFEYAPSNFPAAILTTVFIIFMTPFFYPPEMEDAEGFDEVEDGSGGLAPKPAPKAIEGVAAAAPAGATNNNNTTATNHVAVPVQTPQIAAHNHNKKHVKNSVESTQVARNPLNEKYSVLMQVFDTRGLRDSRNHNVSGDEVSDDEDQQDTDDNNNNNDNRSANHNNNNENGNSQELGAATHEASGVFSKLRRLGNNIQSFGLSVAHGGNADHSTRKNKKSENKKSDKNKKYTPGLQCIVGRKESEALAFIPQELLNRLQLKWLDRSIFDVSEGGKNDDDMTITADSYDTQSSERQAPSPNQKKGAAGSAASPGTLSPKAVPPLAPPQRSASAAVKPVKPKQNPVLDADDLEHHKAASGFHFARHRRQESSYSDTDEGKKKSSHQQEMVISPSSKPQLQQQQQQGPNDENNNHDDEVPATPGRNHHHHHHHSRTRSGTMPPKIISSQELAPDSEKFEKVGHVTITTTTTTKTVNGKVVVVNESKEHLESEKVIEKDDIVSVRGTIKDLRTFRSLLALSWVGVADLGRSRIVFQQHHQIKKAEADRRRAAEKMKISFKDFDMEMKPTASHNKPQQHQQRTKPETAVFPAAPLASVGNPSNTNNNNNLPGDSKQNTVPSATDANTSNTNNNTQHANDDVDAEVVSRRESTQDLAEGEIPLPAHTPLTSEALARIAQDPEHTSHHISRHQSDDEEDTMSDDVVGQFKNSSICYLRHASGARYNVKACSLYHGLDAFQPASPESVANTHVFVAVVSGDNPALGQRLENRIFVDTFGCQILACRSFNAGKNLLGRELAWHRLEAGDTLVVRVRPKSAYLWQSNRAQRAFYDIIAQPGSSLLTTAEKDKLMRNYIELPAIIADYFEIGQRSITMRGRVVTLLRLPNWYFNVVPIGIFCFFVASTMLGASVPIMALVCIVLLIWGQIITVHEALQTSDWKLYTSIAFAYAIGEGIAVSGLAQYVGEKIARTGIKGFYAVLACHFLTGFVSCLVGNQGTPTCLFPIAMRMMRIVGIDQLVGLVIVANASASGFMTTFGLPSNLVILTPGRYTPKDFVVFGTPVFIVYGLLSAFFTTWQFGLF